MYNPGKKFLIAGNWKMNLNSREASEFVKSLKRSLKEIQSVEIVICPSYPALETVFREVEGANFRVGAQNMHFEEKGAFTGEVSVLQLKNFCRYVILGHSERRKYFQETDEIVNKKIIVALKHNLMPIICVGENAAEREADKTVSAVSSQVRGVLQNIEKRHLSRLVFAYEPVWAIGTGKTPLPEDASSIILYIRKILSEAYGQEAIKKTKILYGGSIDGKNGPLFLKEPGIEGLLVGGASINLAEFSKIVREAERLASAEEK